MTRSFLTHSAFCALTYVVLTLTGCTATNSATPQILRAAPQTSLQIDMRDPATIRPPDIASFSSSSYSPPSFVRAYEPHPEWVPISKPRSWRYIVIHHSATPNGSAAKFDTEHRAKGWDELGYHFVIDNGHGGPDGCIEIGSRWSKQKHGAHAKTPDSRFNEFGIGICLVGNFDNTRPTPAQYRKLAELIAWLQDRYDIPTENIIGHNDTKPTACPGKNLSVAMIRNMAGQLLVSRKQPAIATASH